MNGLYLFGECHVELSGKCCTGGQAGHSDRGGVNVELLQLLAQPCTVHVYRTQYCLCYIVQ